MLSIHQATSLVECTLCHLSLVGMVPRGHGLPLLVKALPKVGFHEVRVDMIMLGSSHVVEEVEKHKKHSSTNLSIVWSVRL